MKGDTINEVENGLKLKITVTDLHEVNQRERNTNEQSIYQRI